VVVCTPTYFGGEEAQPPLPLEPGERARMPPRGTRVAADFTPAPGTLFALASVTPAAGVPKLTLQPANEVLAAAVAAAGPPAAQPAGAAAERPGRDEDA
jgi:hypothetical protein